MLFFAAVLLLSFATFYPVVWISLPIEGHIVDRATRQPIPGAVVVANWGIDAIHGGPWAQLAVEEVTSDASGRFRLPFWGPRFRFQLGHVPDGAPEILVFKKGYSPLHMHRTQSGYGKASTVIRTPDLQIELQKRPDSDQQYNGELSEMASALERAYSHEPCAWLEIQQMLASLVWEQTAMVERGLTPGTRLSTMNHRCPQELTLSPW